MSTESEEKLKERMRAFARLAWVAVVTCLSCAVVAWAAGGWGFVRRPAGIVLLAVWFFWFLSTGWYRPFGSTSKYSRRARALALLLIPSYMVLLVVIPWEHGHYRGPLPREGLLVWIGLAVFAAGCLLSAWAMLALSGSYTVRLDVKSGQTLVTTGPYAIVRNPGYLGNILSLAGLGLALGSLVGIALAVATAVALQFRIRREERMLIAEFGDQYRAYMQRTRRLLPFVY